VNALGPCYASFTSSAQGGTLSGLQLKLAEFPPGPGTLTVGLYADDSTSPGALVAPLGTFDDTQLLSGYHDYTVTLTSLPALTPNTRYWIGLSDTGGAGWAFSTDTPGPGVGTEYAAISVGFFVNSTDGALQMQVTETQAAPDGGATAGLLGLACLGLVSFRHRS